MIDTAHGKETELGKQMDFCGKYTGEDRILRITAARGRAPRLKPAPWSQQGPAVFRRWLGFPALMWVCALCKIDLWPAIYSFYHILNLRSWPTWGSKSCAFCRGSYFCVCSAKGRSSGSMPWCGRLFKKQMAKLEYLKNNFRPVALGGPQSRFWETCFMFVTV